MCPLHPSDVNHAPRLPLTSPVTSLRYFLIVTLAPGSQASQAALSTDSGEAELSSQTGTENAEVRVGDNSDPDRGVPLIGINQTVICILSPDNAINMHQYRNENKKGDLAQLLIDIN